MAVSSWVIVESAPKLADSYAWNAASRTFSASTLSRSKRSCCSGVNGSSKRGLTQMGVLWKTVR